MDKPIVNIIKIGGNVIDDDGVLTDFLQQLSQLKTPFVLVHGGGKLASNMSTQLGITPQLIDGRRVTDAQTLDIITMVYGGLINKKMVAKLQANGINAIGLSGADGNLMKATQRCNTPIDFGFVGDVSPEDISSELLQQFLSIGLVPVIAPLTHNGSGQLLNTNADTIASCIALALCKQYTTRLFYCFEKNGVLADSTDDTSVISILSQQHYHTLKQTNAIHSGMLPKLNNAFAALNGGVDAVFIAHALQIQHLNHTDYAGTRLVK